MPAERHKISVGLGAESFEETAQISTLKLHVLASGSRGNASIVEDTSTGRSLLIDCGICKRDFLQGCEQLGVDLMRLEGILVTHEHTDHTKGLGVVFRGLAKQGVHPTLYTSRAIQQASREIVNIQEQCDIHNFSDDDALAIAGMDIQTFATSHDVAESYGFRISLGSSEAIGYVTDTGVLMPKNLEVLSETRILALESNHDTKMLETGPYPYVIKRRIASDTGHLSNAQAAEALEALLSNKLEHVVAMHISENNNTYQLPQQVFKDVVEHNAHHAQVRAAFQHRRVSI